MIKIGLLHSTIREDEKLLMRAAKEQGIELIVLDVRSQILNPYLYKAKFDVLLERCVSTTIGMHATMFFEAMGMTVVNNLKVAQVCENKFITSLTLKNNNVPTIPFLIVFTEKEAKLAIEKLGGYPVVLKPVLGSWGRLLAKINDEEALEAIIEQKIVLGSPSHKVFYLQKYIEKPGRDIRITVAGNNVVCAIYRETSHWITNTARGAQAKPCKVDKCLEKISLAAARAVGGGVLGIDVFETANGYVVNEVNHTTEFKNVQRVTGVDVAGAIINYCMEAVKR